MRNAKQFSNILNAVEKAKSGGNYKDDDANMWKLEGDKAGNGRAVIRFLPGKDDDANVFVKTFSHGFKNEAGKWFIENCPTTIGKECPVCEANGVLVGDMDWKQVPEDIKKVVRNRKRKVSYITNVLVVEDPTHPDNEGKVFLFKFGQSIFDKIALKIKPQFEDDEALNPFDAEEGANFKIRMRRVDGYANFDTSEFSAAEPIGNDKRIKEVISQLHDIETFVDPKQFKSYDDMSTKLNSVLGGASNNSARRQARPADEDDNIDMLNAAAAGSAKKSSTKSDDVDPTQDIPMTSTKSSAPAMDDDDDSIDFFKNLAKD
jgi:hypothetical protein